MKAIERYHQYKDEALDVIILRIKHGNLKCGRYSNLVKTKPDIKEFKKQVEFFGGVNNGHELNKIK